jgi:dCTP deaminase
MILVDHEIIAHAEVGKISIYPFDKGSVNPASYDLHLGTDYQVGVLEEELDPYNHISIRHNFVQQTAKELWLESGGFMLATSTERIGIPPDMVGIVKGKSSIARLGLSIEDAGLIDPGFHGQITFEITNNHPSPVKLYAGMPIAQIAFIKTMPCSFPYGQRATSKYQHQDGATISRYHLNGERRGFE